MGNKRPIHEIKLGRIRAVIWRNESENRKPWFNATAGRLYKKNGEWKETSSYGSEDCLVASEALKMAWRWMMSRKQQLENEQRASSVEGAKSHVD